MKTITLTIPSMKSAHCQMAVRQAIESTGASIDQLTPGLASVKIDENEDDEAVVQAVKQAGYPVTAKA